MDCFKREPLTEPCTHCMLCAKIDDKLNFWEQHLHGYIH